MLTCYLRDIEELIKTFRAERHENMQTIQSLAFLGKYEELKQYLNKIVGNYRSIEKILRLGDTALTALINVKIEMMRRNNINFEVKYNGLGIYHTRLDSFELSTVVGNVIDNAIEAVKERESNRIIYFEVTGKQKFYIVKISNNGPAIKEEDFKKIYEAGYSTKHKDTRGFGLYIVKNIMDKYNGTIQLNSDEKLTSFIEEIYTACTGKEAEDIIREESPQILLLDIELPDINGINVAKTAVSLNPDVFVVFITGYSSYATESFEVHPYDYILKPIDFERFRETLNFVTIKCENNILNRKLKATGKLPVKSGNGILFLNLKDIIFIERLGEKTKIHTRKKAYECTDHLKNLEASLNGNFYRVHKSYIVNMEMVEKIENLRDTYEISFYDYNEKAYMSKGRYQFLKEKFQI